MNIRRFVSKLRSDRRRKIRRTWTRSAQGQFERLEDRSMLAGNVMANFVGRDIYLRGDALDNSFEVVAENGDVIVRGMNSTTINGSATFTIASGTTSLRDDLRIFLGSGNNTLIVGSGVTISDDLDIWGGSGDDSIGLVESVVGDDLRINGISGSDTISVQDSQIGDHARIRGGIGGANTINFSNSSVGDDLRVYGGVGADTIVIDNVTVADDTRVYAFSGNDDVVVRNSTIHDDLSVLGYSGDDVVVVEGSTVGDDARVYGMSGSDSVSIQNSSTVGDKFRTYGGSGADAVEIDSSSTAGRPRTFSVDSSTVDPDILTTRITDPTSGALAKAAAAVGFFDPTLSISVSSATVAEAAGTSAVTATITRSTRTDSDLVVTLSTSDASKLVFQTTSVTIPAGQSSVTVNLDAIDNTIFDADVAVDLTATASDFDDGTATVTVTNDDAGELTVALGATTVAEDTGSSSTTGSANTVAVTISRNSDTTGPLTVTLASSSSGRLIVPATATIPAGSSSVVVNATTVANTVVDGDVTVTITATATGLIAGSQSIDVTDNDSAFLTVDFGGASPSVQEPNTATVTISRNTDTTQALTVNLVSDNTDQLTVPATAVIPAGQSSVIVTVSTVNEDLSDGDVLVGVTASAAGFVSGSDTIAVQNDDAPALNLTFASTDIDESSGSVATLATVTRNTTHNPLPLTVTLTPTANSRITIPTTVVIPANSTSVTFDVDTVDNDIVDGDLLISVQASADLFTAASADVTVNDDDVATVTITPSTSVVNENDGAAAATLTIARTTDTSADETVTLTYSDTTVLSGPTSVTIPAGETSVTVDLDATDNSSFNPNASVTITATATGHKTVTTTITVANDEVLTLTTDLSSNTTADSVGTLITRNAAFTVAGTSAEGATVQIDTDNDGLFDDGTQVVGADGLFSFNVTLVNNATNRGRNPMKVRAFADTQDLVVDVDVHLAVGTVVRFQINQDLDNANGSDFYDVELLDSDAAGTVANFLSYVDAGRYDNLIVHRSPPNFVIQAGGFTVNSGEISSVPVFGQIAGEFNSANSNLFGTLSMALSGFPDGSGTNPNSGTSQWFVNAVDNAGLDAATHTVFGRVIGDGMSVVTAINDLNTANLFSFYGEAALTETPLTGFDATNTPLTGTVSTSTGSNFISGVGTQFTTELQVGDSVSIDGSVFFVDSITSDLEFRATQVETLGVSGVFAIKDVTPTDDEFIVFTDIGRILDSL